MFATLTGAWPHDPDDVRGVEARVAALLGLQVESGLEPLTAGGLWWPDSTAGLLAPGTGPTVADAWSATRAMAGDAVVKQAVPGPLTLASRAGRPVEEMADLVAAAITGLVAAGCPVVEVEEPAALEIADDAGRDRFVTLHRHILAPVAGRAHATLALVGGSAEGLGVAALAAVPYHSFLFDLIAGPDSWRVIAALPGERGIVCGALRLDGRGGDPAPLLSWAARYAASMRGRGMARVGLANAGSLAVLTPAGAEDRVRALGRAARLAAMAPADAVEAGLDPRSFDARTAALGRMTPRPARRTRRPPGPGAG